MLAKARDAKGLTQEQVAKLLDRSRGTVADWERGRNGIRGGSQGEVARVYGVEVSELVA